MKRLRLAIVGCGTIVEKTRLPALAGSHSFELAALVDPDLRQAEALAERTGCPAVFSDICDLPRDIDAALIATPNALHTEAAIQLAGRGVHLCVEKPLAPSSEECRRMLAAAGASGVVLMTAFDRRYRPQFQKAKRLIEDGLLGPIRHVEVAEGGPFNWQSRTSFYCDATAAGGGVLLDAGIHVLDQLGWWFGPPADIDYADDSLGGMETECRVQLRYANGATADLEFSRIRKLSGTTTVRGELATLRISPWSPRIEIEAHDGPVPEAAQPGAARGEIDSQKEGAIALWQDFARAIREGGTPLSSAAAGMAAIGLVEECYRRRRPIDLPWVRTPRPLRQPSSRDSALAGCKVLVTGGSGFLGGRIVEKLRLQHGASEIRVLTRRPERALRAARTGARIVGGDIADRSAVFAASEGCQLIIHCARDDSRDEAERFEKTMTGTANVIAAAAHHPPARLINVSSMVVYGRPAEAELHEDLPYRPDESIYARMKAASDTLVCNAMADDGLAATNIQPTIIYGPWGGWWTRGHLQRLQRTRLALPMDLPGICNLVYVDDVADAILLAAGSDQAVGESILVSGPEPVSWHAYFAALDRIKGGADALVLMAAGEMERLRQNGAPEGLELPAGSFLRDLNYPATVTNHKAHRLLGYRPEFGLEAGMALTGQWAVYAGLAPYSRTT